MFEEYNNFKITPPYHDGRRLLSMLDIDKQKPGFFIDTSNRSAGKTTFYNGYLVDNFLKKGKKFCLIYRNKYELEVVCDSFFKDIQGLFFSGLTMSAESKASGSIYFLNISELGDNAEKFNCGYAISLSGADQIKKMSHMLSDTEVILFDEFQLESRKYLKNEILIFQSIYASIARGQGQQSRYVPVILVGNLIDMYNPYFEAFGISERLNINTNYMRGKGWVLAQGFNESSAKALSQSAVQRAFLNNDYDSVLTKKEYLFDDTANIRKDIPNVGLYLGTIMHKNALYGVRYIETLGIIYVSEKFEKSWKQIFAATESDISNNSIFFKKSKLREKLTNYLHSGTLYFANMACKKAATAFIYNRSA